MYIFHIHLDMKILFAGTYRGAVESLIGEDADSEWLIWILNDQT